MHGVFAPYRGKCLADFQICHESHQPALDAAMHYAKDLDKARLSGRGLTLIGPNGVGKTMLACGVLNEAQEQGYRVECIELASYVALWKDKFATQALIRAGHEPSVDRYVTIDHHIRFIRGNLSKGADFLLLDDIGREYQSESGWSAQELFDTLRFRYNRRLPTLLTSNVPVSEWERRYTEGLSSFVHEATDIVVVEGDDYRWREAS
jgi:DNA replication protein DnaC